MRLVLRCDSARAHHFPAIDNKMRKYRYYEVLEISRTATQEEINGAFRRLARLWHPDRNPGRAEAESVFRRVNTAYQVLANEAVRAEYDRSSVECPTCGTHEVLSMNDGRWQCKHCGCRFDVSGTAEIHAMDAPSAPPLRRARFRAFQAMQCSWCVRFYDRAPSTCPHHTPQTNCDAFKAVTESERKAYLTNPAMPALVDEWVRPTGERGLIKKCTYCRALNPNPSRVNEPCWHCHRVLKDECPHCGLAMMLYDIERGAWRCANNQCAGKRFEFNNGAGKWSATVHHSSAPPPRRSKRRPKQPSCLNCGAGLVYSDLQSLWCCVVCRNFFTPDQAGWPAPKDAPIPVRATRRRRESAVRPERPLREHPRACADFVRPLSRPRKRKSTADYVLLGAAIGLLLLIGTLMAFGMAGHLG